MIINKIGVIFILLAVLLLSYLCHSINDYSLILTWLTGSFISLLLSKKIIKQLYLFSFGINTIVAVIFCLENYYTTGYLHTLFLDDKEFYETTLKLVPASIETYFKLPRLTVFYFFTTKVYQFLEMFGINSVSYFHYLIYNLIFGSLIPGLVYRLNLSLFKNKQTALRCALFVMLFPTLIYFSAIGLRDVWVTFFFLLFIVNYVNFKGNFYFKWIYLIAITICIFFLRHQNVIYPISFVLLYNLFKSDSLKIKGYILLFSCLGFLIFSINYYDTIEEYYLWYKNFNYQVNSSSSLGIKLKHESGIIGKLGYFIYFIFGPFPLLSFTEISIARVFLDLGTLSWYLVIPIYIIQSIEKFKNPFTGSFFLVFILNSLILSQITGHLRHKTVFIPIILMLFYEYIVNSRSEKIFRILNAIFIIYALLGAAYLSLKFI